MNSEQQEKLQKNQKNLRKSVNNKKLRFDEENIRSTNHPIEKDYGFMSIPESKTPFPRHADAVEANDLRKRLQEALERANRRMLADDSIDMDVTQSQEYEDESNEYYEEKRRAEFLKKRKQFYQSEFIIAKQKQMSSEIPDPGPSVGDNWRIVQNVEHIPIGAVPSTLTSFISRTRLPSQNTTINNETLREIAEQMARPSYFHYNQSD